MKIYYRISDAGRAKLKLPEGDKISCLRNFLSIFGDQEILVVCDNCSLSTVNKIRGLNLDYIETNLGNAKSALYVLQKACSELGQNEYVYFVEDDYLHLQGSCQVIMDGLGVADYVTLYDHPDKYLIKNSDRALNPAIRKYGERTELFAGEFGHWKFTNSTTMTWATRVSTLKSDLWIWKLFLKGNIPNDFGAFLFLQRKDLLHVILKGRQLKLCFKLPLLLLSKKRTLISPVPGFSTHVEKDNLTPYRQWKKK